MGVREWLLRQAALRPRPLVVGCPYGTRARLLVEAEADRRGWVAAAAPAEAGLLVVCGAAGSEIGQAVEVVWEAVPAPRVLVEAASDASAGAVRRALDDAVAELAAGGLDGGARHGDAGRPVAMAGRGRDRDGLTLDRLHVPLGPVLADWPAGLVVETVLQGDVIQEAVVRAASAGADGVSFWDPPRRDETDRDETDRDETERREAARCLDSLGRLLAVAGWPGAAREARRLRDRLLAGAAPAGLRRDCERFARRVRRSRVLRWMLRGVGPVEGRAGVPERLRGDALDRAYGWLDTLPSPLPDDPAPATQNGGSRHDGDPGGAGACGGGQRVDRVVGADGADGVVLGLLAGLLVGAESAVARLIVASLDPDLDRLPASAAVRRG
ncbi:hypothetical protein FAF44_43510 [Nonomuraea sp. MG754425]|uniref:hypothetical protein n=1 Tax=Nonomuraea sp. MG754425 TaxID=2570319 RepID=UPI001F48A804|nr:hypothetical protein [Nonomuraea sp. MG754425]MCF6475194.1 hypothetical protein [Nonomuraea sp. MG754425]